MIICIIVLVILCAVLSVIIYRQNKEKEKYTKMQKRFDVLVEEYIALVKLDILHDTFEVIRVENVVEKLLQEVHDHANFQLKTVMSKMVADGPKEELLNFVELSTLMERMNGNRRIAYDFLGRVNGWCRVEFLMEDEQKQFVLFAVKVIQEDKQRENQLRFLTENDALSGLHNEKFGTEELEKQLQKGTVGMFCLIEVDHFKEINEKYGSSIGDCVIVEVANTLKSNFKEKDILFRRGGARFAVFSVNVQDKQDARFIMQTLESSLESLKIEDLKITISSGVSFYRADEAIGYEELLKRAENCIHISREIDGVSVSYYD